MVNNDKDKGLNDFIREFRKKFQMYFVAYGSTKIGEGYKVNLIVDDRDVLHMGKQDLIKKMSEMTSKLLKKNKTIRFQILLVSSLNRENVWNLLGKSAVIYNVDSISSFINLEVPSQSLEVYERLPSKFKLSDFERESFSKTQKKYHRNTYQNWLKSLKEAGFLKLKKKTYEKIEGNYKTQLIGERI